MSKETIKVIHITQRPKRHGFFKQGTIRNLKTPDGENVAMWEIAFSSIESLEGTLYSRKKDLKSFNRIMIDGELETHPLLLDYLTKLFKGTDIPIEFRNIKIKEGK